MPSPLFTQLNGGSSKNPMIEQLMQFKKTFTGNPQQMVMNLINSGRVTQEQVNNYAKQADELIRQLR